MRRPQRSDFVIPSELSLIAWVLLFVLMGACASSGNLTFLIYAGFSLVVISLLRIEAAISKSKS